MHADITRLDLLARRRSLTGYALGLAAYALVVVALYPAFKNTSSLDKLIQADPAAAALFGVTGSISSSGGWLDGNLYANFFPLILLLLTVGYGAASLAGQDEDGTLCMLTVLPVRRAAIVTQKIAAMAVQAAVLAAAVAACVIIGRSFQLSVTAGDVAAVSAAAFLMAIDFGIVTMAAGAVTGRRGTAIGAGSALAAASYLISSLAPVVSWLSPARYASLLYWSVGNSQITRARVPPARCPLNPVRAARQPETTRPASGPQAAGLRVNRAASPAHPPPTCDAWRGTNARTSPRSSRPCPCGSGRRRRCASSGGSAMSSRMSSATTTWISAACSRSPPAGGCGSAASTPPPWRDTRRAARSSCWHC